MPAYFVAAASTVVLLALLLLAEVRHTPVLRWLTKPLASLGFLAAALSAGAPTGSSGQVLIAALALCIVGDVLLIPAGRAAFLGGLGAFLTGHLLFALSFALRGVSWPATAGIAVGIAPISWLVRRWLAPHLPAKMVTPVTAYIVAISGMVCLAGGSAAARPGAQAGLLAGGAVAFFLSDLAVARNRFISPDVSNRLWGLPLYYGAQLAFAAAVALYR